MKFKYLSSFMTLVFFSTGLLAQIDDSEVHKQYSTGKFFEILKPYQSSQFAVGIQAKGKLANVITNFGQLGQFHVYTPSLNWPAFGEGQDDQQHYGWGVDFMMGYNGDVMESFQDPASNLISRDWQQADENLYSGNVTVSENDLTPLMATSDNKDTWPIGDDGKPFWPGLFRQDTEGNVYPGEFTSERDLYCVFTDAGNDTQHGFRVELTAYSFTRRYAEDFLVYRFNIKNTSQTTLENIYPGMMIQFLIDFDEHDLINFIDSNNDGKDDFIYMWDEDQTPKEPWSKVGYIGLVVVKSSNPAGITNFHYFHDDFIPSKDEDYWMMLTSDDSMIPDTTRSKYFHGSNKYIDDVSLAAGLDPDGNNKGGKISWMYSLGPLTLSPSDSVQMEIAIICGDDEQDLLDNAEWVWFLAGNAWNGSNPPSSPEVQAFAGDGKVTVTWNSAAEKSTDNVTALEDFEGYKIYRSTDHGKTWGKEITDSKGNFRSFQPLAQFDHINGITGNDPISNQYLGKDTGIKHTFVDSTVVNGIEYWYAVTAYDKGDDVNMVESLESSLGLTVDEVNVAAAIPQTLPSNFVPGSTSNNDYMEPIQGLTDAKVYLEILDPTQLKTRDYQITFKVDTTTTFTLSDANTNTVLLLDRPLTDASGDNIVVIDGFRINIEDTESGLNSAWTKVAGDTCTFDWRFESVDPSSNMLIQGEIATSDDWRITIDYNQSLDAHWVDLFTGTVQDTVQPLPLKIEIITDPENPIDASDDTWLGEFAIAGPWDFRKNFYSQLGWDLEPGGLGYLAASPGWYEKHVDVIILEKIETDPATGDTIPNYLYMFTNNKPDTSYLFDGTMDIISAKAPSQGDEFTILKNKPINDEVVYTFSTNAGSFRESEKSDLTEIKVVPNPFFVSSSFDDNIIFTHLPSRCVIDIYNVAGDLVRTLNHENDTGISNWDLKNDQGLIVAYGLYVYVVKTGNGEKRVGKFSIIR